MSSHSKKPEHSVWVVSSFGDPKTNDVIKRRQSKSTRSAIPKGVALSSTSKSRPPFMKTGDRTLCDNGRLWIDKHQPRDENRLAVHKKKYQDVRSWFELRLSDANRDGRHQSSGVGAGLLLTGPAGAGKTATIRLLAEQLGYDVREWINRPGIVADYGHQQFDESQTITFRDFLLRTGQYSGQIFADDKGKKKLILIEDFPTAFTTRAEEMHNILRKFFKVSSCAIVFIVTDSASNASNERTLFPESFRNEANIAHISFNPVAPTNMVLALKRIADDEHLDVSKESLESLAKSSSGDIRSAVNALQFRCDLGVTLASKGKMATSGTRLRRGQPKKVRRDDGRTLVPFAGRDDSLFLFHILGKILHCRRDTEIVDVPATLPPHLKPMERLPLSVNPEEVFERSSISASAFGAFLHQNYEPFFADIEDANRVLEHLSLADVFLGDWAGVDALHLYAVSVATRGIMFSRKQKVAGGGFKPLYKPKLFAVQQSCSVNSKAVRNLFEDIYFSLSPCDLFSQVVPYLRQYFSSVLTSAQKSLLENNFRPFSGKTFLGRQQCDSLSDIDTGVTAIEPDESEHVAKDKPEVRLVKETPDVSDDEYVIEEFDD